MSSMRPNSKSAEAGFALLETLIALAVTGMVLGAFYQTIAIGMQLQQRAHDHADRVLAAARVLDELGSAYPLRPAQFEGRSADGRFAWTLTISGDPVLAAENGNVALEKSVHVAVAVSSEPASSAPPFVVETIRVMPEIMP
jgi:type II secretory pathway component PulJ